MPIKSLEALTVYDPDRHRYINIDPTDFNHLAVAVVNDLENNFCVDTKGEDMPITSIKLSELEKSYLKYDANITANIAAEMYVRLFGPEWKKWRAKVDRVIFNDPATIILWKSGEKTVVKCGPNDIYDKEKGLAMALCKYVLGNKGNFNQFFKTFMEE